MEISGLDAMRIKETTTRGHCKMEGCPKYCGIVNWTRVAFGEKCWRMIGEEAVRRQVIMIIMMMIFERQKESERE